MPLFDKPVMFPVAVIAMTSLVFGTAGPALSEEQLSDRPDLTIDAESILMEGVDPSVAMMSEDQLLAKAQEGSDLNVANPARDLIVQRMTEAKHASGQAEATADQHGDHALSVQSRKPLTDKQNSGALETVLSELVAPSGNVDDVQAVMAEKDISAAMEQNGYSAESLPQVDEQRGTVRLTHPSKEGRSVSISPKGSTKVNEIEGVVESKNEDTGVLSVSQVTSDMGGQVVSLLNSAETPYVDFEATLPMGYALAPEADGTVSIRDTMGQVEGKIDNAWAVDANGKKLATHYEVLGDGTLRQHVDTTDASFPIAADPSWHWWVATSAMCAVELALLLTPVKVATIVARLRSLVKSSRAIQRAVSALGGIKNSAIVVLKSAANRLKSALGKWGKALPSFKLTATQAAKGREILGKIGLGIWELLGFGSCFSIIKEVSK